MSELTRPNEKFWNLNAKIWESFLTYDAIFLRNKTRYKGQFWDRIFRSFLAEKRERTSLNFMDGWWSTRVESSSIQKDLFSNVGLILLNRLKVKKISTHIYEPCYWAKFLSAYQVQDFLSRMSDGEIFPFRKKFCKAQDLLLFPTFGRWLFYIHCPSFSRLIFKWAENLKG